MVSESAIAHVGIGVKLVVVTCADAKVNELEQMALASSLKIRRITINLLKSWL
ncbi:hypothetical protein LBMAG48_26860 [Phycisphaerae bacterium]|nr:hypothetical protein LBMAG48_26860 [Phycisphaerae bacterium]